MATKVAEANEKLYINREEGFIGTGLKKDEYVCNCSDIDDVIIFYKDGKYVLAGEGNKAFTSEEFTHFLEDLTKTVPNRFYRRRSGRV